MKKILTLLFIVLFTLAGASAQTAKQVLDKAAAKVSNKGGMQANYSMSGAFGNSSGTIAIKGTKFHATSGDAIVWFDGKTIWTYMKKNNEVNVSDPSGSKLQSLNPYNFVNMYKSGYNYTLKKVGANYEVHLTATTSNKNISEMYLTINKQYVPTQVKVKQKKGWTTFNVSNVKTKNLSDATFRFNAKDYPSAEVIDLR